MKIVDWIKGLFSSQEERNEEWSKPTPTEDHYGSEPLELAFLPSMVETIHVNPNVYLAHRGARICVGKLPIDGSVVDRMNHLSKVVGMGHESVMEHTNAIVVFKVPDVWVQEEYAVWFAEMMASLKYCNVSVQWIANRDFASIKHRWLDGGYVYLLVGGSCRGFMHALRECSIHNPFKAFLQEALYSCYEKCFLGSLIDHQLLDPDRCTYLGNGKVTMVKSKVTQVKNRLESVEGDNEDAVCDYVDDPQEVQSDCADLVYASPINAIHDKVKQYGFTLRDVYKVATLSFVFHDVSRTCSHQLVRHRNGISQESQRYVTHDYTKKDGFVDPIQLNLRERYSGPEFKGVLDYTRELNPFKPYLYLISNKVAKEDARAWLPSNVTTRLMMTFTYEHYGAFLKLRLASGAQKEIRDLAEETVSLVMDPSNLEEFIEYVTTPIAYRKEGWLENPLAPGIDSMDVDETISEEPRSLEVNTPEDAQKLFDLQERYKKVEDQL